MSATTLSLTPASAPSILVIEDSRVDRELISLLLRGRGFDVSGTGTLADAITRLQSRVPDIIVLDEQLPDGLSSQNIDRIRAHASSTPLVFVSGNLDLATALALSQHGVSAIFNKPVNPKSLVAKLQELINSLSLRPAPSANGGTPPPAASAAVSSAPSPASPPPASSAFRWTCFPGSCPAHQRLGAQLAKVCDFRSTLLLLGQPGFAFFPLVRDLHANSALRSAPLLTFSADSFSRALLSTRLARHVLCAEPVTLALDHIETYDAEQSRLLDDLIHFRGAFSASSGRIRIVLSASLTFLDEPATPSRLSPDLVERIAALMVNVPALSALRENRVLLARRLLSEVGSTAKLTDDTVRWLERRSWPRDYHQFRRVILVAATSAATGSLTPEILESAYNLESTLPPDAYAPVFIDAVPPVEAAHDEATAPSDASEPGAPTETAAPASSPDGFDRYLATPTVPEPTPAAAPPPPPARNEKKRGRVGAYDFSSRLNASLEAAPATPPPASPVHPRFAPKPGSASSS